MPIVCSSLVAVIRARKALQNALEAGDWDAVKAHDAEVGPALDEAFSDELRDNAALIGELEKILALYAKVVTALPEATAQRWLTAKRPVEA